MSAYVGCSKNLKDLEAGRAGRARLWLAVTEHAAWVSRLRVYDIGFVVG